VTRRLAIEAVEQEVAARQFGVFTELQAFHWNVSKDMVSHHSEPGRRWRRVAPRVYEVLALPADWRRPLMAAQLSIGPKAVLSHRAAAAVLGMDGVRPGVVELTAPTGGTHPGWIRHRNVVPDDDIIMTGPLRHTTVIRTVADLAGVLDDEHWEMALEWVLRKGGTIVVPKSKGAARAKRVLAQRPPDAPPTGSELETRFVQLVRRAGLPQPDRQFPVSSRGEVIAYVDLAWPALEFFAELDGVAFHDREQALLYDRHRQNQIVTILGWRPLRYTWDDVVKRPSTTTRELRSALGRGPRRR
jgi:very-short-patch-repair endonuclease